MIEELWSSLTPADQIFWWGNICLVWGYLIARGVDYVEKWYRGQNGANQK